MPPDIDDCVAFPVPDTTWSAGRILDEGSKALNYFERFGPRYERWVGAAPAGAKSYAELHGLFYAQNGLDEQRFGGLASTLADVLNHARAQHDELNRLAQGLPSIWSGESASNASLMIAEQLRLSSGDIDAVQKIQEQFALAPGALRKVMLPKAENVAATLQYPDEITYRDRSPEDVDEIISGARGVGWSTSGDGDLLGRLQKIFPDEVGGQIFSVPGLSGDLEDFCRDWLKGFQSDYELKIGVFIQTCVDVNNAVREQYNTLTGLLGKLSETAYPCPRAIQETPGAPAGAPTAPTPSGAPTGTPTGTETPGTTEDPGTTEEPGTTEDPGTTQDPGTTDPLSTLTELGTQLASSELGSRLTSGIGQLIGSATDQISGGLEYLLGQVEPAADLDGDGEPDEDEDGDGQPDDPAAAGEPEVGEGARGEGVELNGRDYKLELGPEGQLQLVVTDENDAPKTYRMEIGSDGVPSIVVAEPEGDRASDAGAADPDAQEPRGAGRPADSPGPQAGERTGDGAHYPQDYPGPAEDESSGEVAEPQVGDNVAPPPDPGAGTQPATPPVETGARLAEAGPL